MNLHPKLTPLHSGVSSALRDARLSIHSLKYEHYDRVKGCLQFSSYVHRVYT